MSTLRVNKLENTNTSNGGISIDTSGHVSIDGQQLPSSGPLSNRNLIINGEMQVAQRGTSFTVTDAYTLDRYKFKENTAGAATVTQSSDAPDGFSYSLKVDVDTADTSVASTDHGILMHYVEGYNFAQANFGSSAAKKVTLSFWVRSNKIGTYGVAFQNSAQNRSRVKEYTISSANTWEHKTITLDEDTSGTWLTTNGVGLKITWGLMGGSTYATSDLSNWNTSNVFLTSNQVNLFDDDTNEWYLTGVQLEVGSVATPFEHRSYSDELAKCQRYFISVHDARLRGIASSSTGLNRLGMTLPTTMRTAPCCAPLTGTLDWYDGSNVGGITSFNTLYATQDSVELDCTVNSGTTAAQTPIAVYIGNNGNALEISAEL